MKIELLNIPKEKLLWSLLSIQQKGWIHTERSKNDGAVGNTLEDLLEIPENNLAIANTVDWELKAQRKKTSSMITLFHIDPQPRKPESVVSRVLLPFYGWAHKEAGLKYPLNEMSFRATLNGNTYTDRGMKLNVESLKRTVDIVYNPEKTSERHKEWFERVVSYHGPTEKVIASWSFDDLQTKCVGKIRNTIYVVADSRTVNEQEEFNFEKIMLLEDFAFNKFLRGLISGHILVDFDARTRHNHGTKFRIKQNNWPVLYSKITELTDQHEALTPPTC
jgi:hypothetical protein